METVTIAFRVHRSLRDSFMRACEQDDNTASRLFRAFMRTYIAEHAQLELKPIGRPRKSKVGELAAGRALTAIPR